MNATFEQARRADLVEVAKHLGARLKRQGVEWVGPCPRCGGTDRFAVNGRKQVYHCRGCASGGDAIDLVALVHAVSKSEAARLLSGAEIHPAKPPVAPVVDGGSDHTQGALRIWGEALSIQESAVESCLARRGVTLPSRGGESVRFHPACPFASKRTPCMVTLVRDIRTDEPKAIHRTALTLDGHNVKVGGRDRMALGPVGGGAIKLTPDEDVTVCLGIAEGVETTLSMQNIPEFGLTPVWSVLSAGGIAVFPVLPGIEVLWVAVDHDASGAGQRAARACADRWRAAGREVFLVKPDAVCSDLNDLFRGAADA